jgi:site-specific DNA-methyltransferase (cytosine-N4-specific)
MGTKASIQRDLAGIAKESMGIRKRITQADAYLPNSLRQELECYYRDIIIEDLDIAYKVSYVKNRHIPFLRIYRYKEAFSFDFVNDFLDKFHADHNDYVFDPFSGLGTTAYTSMLRGIPSIGIDKLPIAYFSSKTLPLFLLLNENELTQKWKALIPDIDNNTPATIASDVAIMKIAFAEETLIVLRKIKSAIDAQPNPYRDILLLLFFSILDECSLTSKDGQFLRLKPDKETSDPIKAMSRKVSQVEEDIHRLKLLHPNITVSDEIIPDVFLGDTRDLSDIKFKKKPTILITSPPYVNRYDYTRSYSLELCFHFVKNFEDLKVLRFGILRSHVESKIGKEEGSPHPVITEILDALSNKSLNNPRIPIMITTYFIDMQKVIKEWFRVLAPGAHVAMVVDNVRFEGELIPVDLILSKMAEEAGFTVKEVIVARYKGNSSQQMKKYGKVSVRESIVVWEK